MKITLSFLFIMLLSIGIGMLYFVFIKTSSLL